MIIVVIGIYLTIGIIEMLPLYKGKKLKEFIFYCLLWSYAFVISILLMLDVDIPSPMIPIEKVVLKILGK